MKAIFTASALVLLTLIQVHAADVPGPVIGIGVAIKSKDHHPFIEQVVPGNPADKSGLQAGDRLVMIDGTDVDGLPTREVALRLRGAAGTRVRITVLRHGFSRTYNVKRQVVMLIPPNGMP